MAAGIPARLSAAEGRRFGLTVGVAFLMLAALAAWRGRAAVATVLGAVGAGLVLGGLLAPGTLGPVQRAWMGLAAVLSRVTTPLFLAVVYFGLIAPLGLVLRALGRTPLPRPRPGQSAWVPRTATTSDLERQF